MTRKNDLKIRMMRMSPQSSFSTRKYNVVSVDVIIGKARKCSYLKDGMREHSLKILFEMYDEQGMLVRAMLKDMLWIPLGFNAAGMVEDLVRRHLEYDDYVMDWHTYAGIKGDLATYSYRNAAA